MPSRLSDREDCGDNSNMRGLLFDASQTHGVAWAKRLSN